MGRLIDLTGQRFGRLTVLERAENGADGHARWVCRCECGNTTVVNGKDLRRGHIQSCGCLQREVTRACHTKHGGCNTRLYRVWKTMKSRCTNPHCKSFPRYGGRGITVCDEWAQSFEAFRGWALGHGYRAGLTLDRIDNDGPYCPENCRWTDRVTQANNMRTNHRVTFRGEDHTIAEWLRLLGINKQTFYDRLSRGWPIEKALGTPAGPKHPKKQE